MSSLARTARSVRNVAAAAAAISGLVRTATTKKKRRPPTSSSAPRQPRRAPVPLAQMTAPLGRPRRVTAPVSNGLTFRGANNSPIVKVPFSSVSNAHIIRDSSSNTAAFLASGTATGTHSSSHFLDIGPGLPVFDLSEHYRYILGRGIGRLSNCFARYRITSLRVTYVPVTSTNVGGNVVIGFNLDPLDSTNSTVTVQMASDASASITTPVYSSASLDATPLLRLLPDWHYCHHSADASELQRFDFAGQLVISGVGINIDGTYGYLRFDGDIEFMSLQDTDDTTVTTVSNRTVVQPEIPPTPYMYVTEVPAPPNSVQGTPSLQGLSAQMRAVSLR